MWQSADVRDGDSACEFQMNTSVAKVASYKLDWEVVLVHCSRGCHRCSQSVLVRKTIKPLILLDKITIEIQIQGILNSLMANFCIRLIRFRRSMNYNPISLDIRINSIHLILFYCCFSYERPSISFQLTKK